MRFVWAAAVSMVLVLPSFMPVPQHPQCRPAGGGVLDHVAGPVSRSVIDHEDLSLQAVYGPGAPELPHQLHRHRRFVEGGHYEREVAAGLRTEATGGLVRIGSAGRAHGAVGVRIALR